ncbi:hypothetical protein, partial [Actinobacillus pleuropneumoniae]|uniref:hypothetical protein n=1 Tax=Actinobacillus pleuropneumoniae TaxID=715 RepID=UPI003B0141D0
NADGSVGFPHVRVGHRQIEFRPRDEGNPVVSDNYGVFVFQNKLTEKQIINRVNLIYSKSYRLLFSSKLTFPTRKLKF